MKTLVTRTITGVFFVAALVGCIVWSEMSFALFFALIAGLGVWEFSANVNRYAGAAVNPFIASTAAVVLVLTTLQFDRGQLRLVPALCRDIALSAH